MVPNCFHHLGTPAAAACLPQAQVVGPKSAAARNPKLRIDVDIHARGLSTACPRSRCFRSRACLFSTRRCFTIAPTETLFGADVVLRGDERDHWSFRLASRLTGCFQRVSVPLMCGRRWWTKQAASQSLRALQSGVDQAMIIAHGSIIEDAP